MNRTSINRLEGGHPILRAIAREHVQWCQTKVDEYFGANKASIEIAQCHRDPLFQDELFARGRNEKGEIVDKNLLVTWARGIDSYHSCLPYGLALAYDIYPLNLETKLLDYKMIPDNLWRAFALRGQTLALTPGYFFSSKKIDPPHYNISLLGFSAAAIHREFAHLPFVVAKEDFRRTWEKQNASIANRLCEQIEKEMTA